MWEEVVTLGELQPVINEVGRRHLLNYLVAIIGIRPPHREELIGSGTLIRVGETYSILTADHVVQRLLGNEGRNNPGYGEIGLVLREREHRYVIPTEELRDGMVTVARDPARREGVGPDLAVIQLPESRVSEIHNAPKCFYDLSEWRDKALSSPPQRDNGAWVLCGYTAILTTIEWPDQTDGYREIHKFEGGFFVGGPEKEPYRQGEYDYCVIQVNDHETSDLPTTFGGTSGGGVWFVPVRKLDGRWDIDAMISETFLAGVIFSEACYGDIVQSITCHGWLSIYERVYDIILRSESA